MTRWRSAAAVGLGVAAAATFVTLALGESLDEQFVIVLVTAVVTGVLVTLIRPER